MCSQLYMDWQKRGISRSLFAQILLKVNKMYLKGGFRPPYINHAELQVNNWKIKGIPIYHKKVNHIIQHKLPQSWLFHVTRSKIKNKSLKYYRLPFAINMNKLK